MLGDAETKVDASLTLSQELTLRTGMTDPAGVWEGYKAIGKDFCWTIEGDGWTLLEKGIHDISIISF